MFTIVTNFHKKIFKNNIDFNSVRGIIVFVGKKKTNHAGVAELADALDLGSSVIDVGVQVLSPAPQQPMVYSIGFFILYIFFQKMYGRIGHGKNL